MQLNKTLLPDILHHTPAGASTYTILHYAQEKQIPGFHAYDWGDPQTNFQHHHEYEPPMYDLGAVTTPVALYWSDNDYFAMPGVSFDQHVITGLNVSCAGHPGHHHGAAKHCQRHEPQCKIIIYKLFAFGTLGINFQVEFELFTHLDFLWGIDADRYVYSYMLENLKTCTETDCRNGRK